MRFLIAALAVAFALPVQAQTWPEKPRAAFAAAIALVFGVLAVTGLWLTHPAASPRRALELTRAELRRDSSDLSA